MINHDNCRTPSRFIIPFPMLAAVQIPFFDISLRVGFYRALVSNNATYLQQFVCFIVVIKLMNVVIVVVVVVVLLLVFLFSLLVVLFSFHDIWHRGFYRSRLWQLMAHSVEAC